jgi:hypothetical protein
MRKKLPDKKFCQLPIAMEDNPNFLFLSGLFMG